MNNPVQYSSFNKKYLNLSVREITLKFKLLRLCHRGQGINNETDLHNYVNSEKKKVNFTSTTLDIKKSIELT